MKIKEGFMLRDIAGVPTVVATGQACETFQGIIKLNDTAKEVWLGIDAGLDEEQIVERLLEIYDVDRERATADTHALVAQMMSAGLIEP